MTPSKAVTIGTCLAMALALAAVPAAGRADAAGPDAKLLKAAAAQREPLLETIKQFVSIESGSRDIEGLVRGAELLASKLRQLGGQVEIVEPSEATTYRMADTPARIGPMVRATFKGKGTKKILLLAHLDTVYQKGMIEKQPFRIEGNRAYGLGIADEKQGVSLVVHIVSLLRSVQFDGYGALTVLVNCDEEISSPGARAAIAQAGAEHDAVMSFEASRTETDKLSLATSGIAAVELKVEGKASHAGSSPEKGVNALYELSHQIMQMRDLSEPPVGLKLNWTLSQAGTTRNVIPAAARAEADVRVLRVADYDRIEAAVRERAKQQLLPEAKVTVGFERRRPPLEATDASRRMAARAQALYAEAGGKLVVDEKPEGGGTDAAFAALNTKAPVVERFGLQGHGAHSNENEYILLDTIEARLYMGAGLIREISSGKAF